MGIKKLRKENELLNLTLIEMLSKFDTSKTKKYSQFLVKMFNQKFDKANYNPLRPFRENDPIDRVLPHNSFENTLVRDYICDFIFTYSNMSRFVEFTELMDKGLITENDISKYNSWEMLENNLFEAKNRDMFKKSKKEIHRIFEDEQFLIFKPLTHISSCSYGYQTKWCTSMVNDPEYFYNYSRGILIYLINKKTNVKFAFYKYIPDIFGQESDRHENYVFKTFNQEDKQIDTIQTGLPQNILEIILKETNDESLTPNYKLFSQQEKEKMRSYIGKLPDEYGTNQELEFTCSEDPININLNQRMGFIEEILNEIQDNINKVHEEPEQ